MMKKFVKGLTVYSCLAFALFNEDCIGMNIKQKSGTEIFSDSNSITTLQPLKKRPKVTVSQIESEDFSGSNAVSDTGSDSSTSSEEWICEHINLINAAKTDEDLFRELIRKLQDDQMIFVYDYICDTYWHNQHLYDTCHDEEKFYGGVCEHQTCGF